MHSQSMVTVKAIQEQLQMPLLETLFYIKEHTYEFSLAELSAFYDVMAGFQNLFATEE